LIGLPQVVDVSWLEEHLGEEDLLVADVRGPNAHARAHIPGSIPLVVGAPGQFTDRDVVAAFASEAGLRLRRHGVTGAERLVLYDDGSLVQAASALQVVELAGHPTVAVLVGGLRAWRGEIATGSAELERAREELEPRLDAVATRAEIASRLGDTSLRLLDVRAPGEYSGKVGKPCDPRQGHIPGASNLDVSLLFDGTGAPLPAEHIASVSGLAFDGDVVAYCHSGSRSGLAMIALRSAGFAARNYVGSWHEWSRHPELPIER
jgi:thiosulfate/3-mercaptopyruvate sulfurtransferase